MSGGGKGFVVGGFGCDEFGGGGTGSGLGCVCVGVFTS